jgi:hypothetical protein
VTGEIMSDDTNDDKKKKKPKGKSFKSIEDILNISDSGGISFDASEEDAAEKKLEAIHKAVDEAKREFAKLKAMPDDDFTKNVLKNLVERSMEMLTALQFEIIDNPTGRAVETAATMVSAINNVVDTFNKKKVYDEKLALDREKHELKALTMNNQNKLGGPVNNTNILMCGDTTEVLSLLQNHGILPSTSPKMKDVDAEIISENNDDKDE